MESDEATENASETSNFKKFFPQKMAFDASTPLSSQKLDPVDIRLSDFRHSNEFTPNTTGSSESCAPSLPSGLLDLVGDDWLNNSSGSNSNFDNILNASNSNNNNTKEVYRIDKDLIGSNSPTDKTNTSDDVSLNVFRCRKRQRKVFPIVDSDFNCSDNENKNSDESTSVFNYLKTEKTGHNRSGETPISPEPQNDNGLLLMKVNKESISKNMSKNLCTVQKTLCETNTKAGNNSGTDLVDEKSSNKSENLDVCNLRLVRSKIQSSASKKKKVFSKQYFCPFCKCLVTKFARHLQGSHSDIEEVQTFMKLPLKSARRSEAITKIRNKGTFLHNTRQDFNTGVLITNRRSQPGYNRTANDFVSCPRCKGFYSKLSFRIHYKKCGKIPEKRKVNIFSLKKRAAI